MFLCYPLYITSCIVMICTILSHILGVVLSLGDQPQVTSPGPAEFAGVMEVAPDVLHVASAAFGLGFNHRV